MRAKNWHFYFQYVGPHKILKYWQERLQVLITYGRVLLLKWLYSPMRTFASLMGLSRSSLIDLTVPRPHLRFPNCWRFPGMGCQPNAQPPTWSTRSSYLYPLETGWPSYTPRHLVPILVAFYDMHGLQWVYSTLLKITIHNLIIGHVVHL
jgi:hypothetical protein